MDEVQLSQRYRATTRFFTAKPTGGPGAHLIELGRMKG